jgi:hypothetical protein
MPAGLERLEQAAEEEEQRMPATLDDRFLIGRARAG